MNNPARYKAAILLSVLLIVLIALIMPEPSVDRQAFISLSGSFAYELGKTYQMGKNCKKELSDIDSSKARGLFIKYMDELEVQQTMNNYEQGVKSKITMNCEKKELKASIPALHSQIDNYFKVAAPFMRSTTQ